MLLFFNIKPGLYLLSRLESTTVNNTSEHFQILATANLFWTYFRLQLQTNRFSQVTHDSFIIIISFNTFHRKVKSSGFALSKKNMSNYQSIKGITIIYYILYPIV